MPSGEPVWVRIESARQDDEGLGEFGGAEDVALGDAVAAVIQVAQLPDFTETVRGVVTSVRQALQHCRPDMVGVEFGIEIAARTGGVVSVLASAGGAAHIKVTASWGRLDDPADRPAPAGGSS